MNTGNSTAKVIYPLLFCLMLAACHRRPTQGGSGQKADSGVPVKAPTYSTPLSLPRPAISDTERIVESLKVNPYIDSNSRFEVSKISTTPEGKKYAIVGVSDGICKLTYLLLLGPSYSIEKCVELEHNCDSDLTRASYSYKDYTNDIDSVFNILLITQRALDSNLIDKHGKLKNGLSLDDVKSATDTVLKRISFSTLNADTVPQWPKIWMRL